MKGFIIMMDLGYPINYFAILVVIEIDNYFICKTVIIPTRKLRGSILKTILDKEFTIIKNPAKDINSLYDEYLHKNNIIVAYAY